MKYLLIIAILFSSCTTMSDIFIDSRAHRSESELRLAKLEAAIVPLEAIGGSEARRQQTELAAARRMITDMERETSADADFTGQLIAWSGRLAILEGRYSEAIRLHRQSNSVSPQNIPAIILSIRLEGNPAMRLQIIDRELALLGPRSLGIGELNIERGRTLAELNRFSEAVGAFDIAFSSGLDKVYSDSYAASRNRAWDLRDTVGVGTGTLDMLGRDAIRWSDCIALARDETQLLRFITAGRNLTDSELFNRLVDRAFIPYTQDITVNEWPEARPRESDPVTRAGAAWFIWHLHAEARGDRGLLSRYSARFATGANPRSPIADVPPLSPFFDSILGCVETEFMSLPDGRNFNPAELMRGTELLSILRRIDN